MRDKIAKWVYLAVERKGLAWRLIRGVYRLQRWAEVPPKLLIRLISRDFLPDLYNQGSSVWSTEMFDKQLRESGMRD